MMFQIPPDSDERTDTVPEPSGNGSGDSSDVGGESYPTTTTDEGNGDSGDWKDLSNDDD